MLSDFAIWQIANFGSTNAPNAASNYVNSAEISNYQLFLAGSDPNNSNTWFRFTALAPVTGNKWGMNFNTVSGRLYSVKWKTNLLDGLGWQFYTNLSGLGGSTQVIFTNNLPQSFFSDSNAIALLLRIDSTQAGDVIQCEHNQSNHVACVD